MVAVEGEELALFDGAADTSKLLVGQKYALNSATLADRSKCAAPSTWRKRGTGPPCDGTILTYANGMERHGMGRHVEGREVDGERWGEMGRHRKG